MRKETACWKWGSSSSRKEQQYKGTSEVRRLYECNQQRGTNHTNYSVCWSYDICGRNATL